MTSERILVVGGNSGIGEAIAENLSADYPQHHICIPFVREEVLRDGDGGERTIQVFDLDVRNDMSIQSYLETYGPYDRIVYTPGINNLAYTEDVTRHTIAGTFNVNAFGFARLLGIHAELFGVERLKSVVAITSDAARNPMRGSLSYCASKAALEMIIRVIAREWMPHTRVNGVAPAVVEDTPMSAHIDATVPGFRGWTPEQAKAYEMSQLPMGRRVHKEEIAEVVSAVLFGPTYQTGSIVHVSGGK